MKNTIIKLLLCIAIVCNVSCNNESKDYENAMKSKKMAVLDAYLDKYVNEAPQEHLDSVSERLRNFMFDSLDYVVYISESDIITRHNLGEEYIKNNPEGLYIDEVERLLKAEETNYQKELKMNEIRNYMGYQYSQSTFPYIEVRFSIPDTEGKGLIVIDNRKGRSAWRYNTYFYKIKDNYDVEVLMSNGDETLPIDWFFSEDGESLTSRNKDNANKFLYKWLGFNEDYYGNNGVDGTIELAKGRYKINQASYIEEDFVRAYNQYGNYVDDPDVVMEYAFNVWKKVGIKENIRRKLSELLDKAAKSNMVEKYNYINKLLESLDY